MTDTTRPATPQTEQPAAPGRPARRPRSRLAIAASGLGQLLVTAGVVVLLFVVYELWGTGAYTAGQQQHLEHQLSATWAHAAAPMPTPTGSPTGSTGPAPASSHPAPSKPADPVYPAVAEGQGFAVLWIPRLGKDYHFVVVQGIQHADLEKGPGHYPGTAMPGQLGNVVVSGHRTTYLAPFSDLDKLRPGDPVVFETATAWYVYRVGGVAAYHLPFREIVLPSDVGEILPVPNQPGRAASVHLFTFTTCHPKYSAQHRLVLHGVLARVVPKPGRPPAELRGAERAAGG